MKKIFSFAIVAAAAMMFAACSGTTNNQGEGTDSVATEEEVTEEVAEPRDVSRYSGHYTVSVPAGWDWEDTVSELMINNENVALKFREGSDIEACKTNTGCTPENKAEEFLIGDISWEAYNTTRDEYQLLYIAQLPQEVLMVWSTSPDPANPDARKILEAITPDPE